MVLGLIWRKMDPSGKEKVGYSRWLQLCEIQSIFLLILFNLVSLILILMPSASPHRKPLSPVRRRSPPGRRGSPRREVDSPPRRRIDSPVRRRPGSPHRRGDSPPPRRRPASPIRGRSPSSPPRRYRSPPRFVVQQYVDFICWVGQFCISN